MKECHKCGATVPDDGIFCPVCGSRADGKQECPSCGRLIDEGAIYCTYCGKRTDGKRKCPSCGELADGDFCPNCGSQITKQPGRNHAETPATTEAQTESDYREEETDEICEKSESNGFSLYGKIANIVSPALMLAATLIAFICSFFVGVKAHATSGNSLPSTYSISENMSAMYFFGDCYKSLKAVFVKPVPGPILAQYIVTTIAVAAGIITSFVLLVVASVKFGKNLRKKKYVNLTGHAAWSMGIVALASASIYCQFGAGLAVTSGNQTVSVSIALNGASLTAIILPLLFIVAAIAVKRVACGKKVLSLAVLGKAICGVVATIFALASLVVVAGELLGVTEVANGYDYELKVSAGLYNYASYLAYYLWWNSVDNGMASASNATTQKPDPSSTIAFATTMVLIVALAITIALTIIAAGKKKSGAGMLAGSIVSLCAATAHLVISILLKNYLLGLDDYASSAQTTITLSIAPSIAALVLTTITLAIAITALVFQSRRKRDCVNENAR